jgi:hypothetical protein
MSSSADLPGWETFALRDAPEAVDILSPASEVAALLQRYRAEVDQATSAASGAERRGLEALAEQAVLAAQLASALERYAAQLKDAGLERVHRHLRVIKDQMFAACAAAGLDLIVPLGASFDEVADLVHVEGWRHRDEFTAEVVAEVVEPIIKHGGTLLRHGRVVMGAPASARPEQE